jgi:serine/threonine protein kinase
MPIATKIKVALGDDPALETVIEAIAAISDTLAALAAEGISHRDIKPDNLYIDV